MATWHLFFVVDIVGEAGSDSKEKPEVEVAAKKAACLVAGGNVQGRSGVGWIPECCSKGRKQSRLKPRVAQEVAILW